MEENFRFQSAKRKVISAREYSNARHSTGTSCKVVYQSDILPSGGCNTAIRAATGRCDVR